ncbi:MAG: DUF29 domain-containing protein [Methylobacter sp.]|nr:DUF29 domain-containing protein [Methylobacter sp.]
MTKYMKDFYSWAKEQIKLLKKGQFDKLDIPNLIKELKTKSDHEKQELERRLILLLIYLLKWKHQPAKRKKSWKFIITEQRTEYAHVLKENQGLQPQLENILSHAYDLARIKAAKKTRLNINTFETTCPWALDDITDDNFYPKQ